MRPWTSDRTARRSGSNCKQVKESGLLNPQIDTVFLCRDNDERGQTANRRTAEALFEKGIQYKVLIPIRKDWNEDLLYPEETEEEICTQQQL